MGFRKSFTVRMKWLSQGSKGASAGTRSSTVAAMIYGTASAASVISGWYGTTLYVFDNISEKANSAAAYLQGQKAEGKTVTRLVISKS